MANNNVQTISQKPINSNGENGLANFNQNDVYDLFQKLIPLFYQKNFGTASKAQIDSLMFHCYIKNLYDYHKSGADINYSQITDYQISNDLGITQSRVRNLKIKDQLMYPRKIDWASVFFNLAKKAVYERTIQKIRIPVSDPNVMIEIANFIELHDEFVEPQPGGKILQIRIEVYADLLSTRFLASHDTSEERKDLLKSIAKQLNLSEDDQTTLDQEMQGFGSKTSNFLTFVSKLTSISSSVGPIATAMINPSNVDKFAAAFSSLIKLVH